MDEEDGGNVRVVRRLTTNKCSVCIRDARKDAKSETAIQMGTGR